jgi:hypothetical protein
MAENRHGKHREGWKDNRKGNRHRADSVNRIGPRGQAYRAGRFVAIDGEGIQVGEKQRYAYLADSTGREIWEPGGISTVRALDFLLGIPRESVVVGFGIGYDVEKILADVPHKIRREIDRGGKPFWGDYRIEYWPRKKFEVWRFSGGKLTGHVRVDDVLSNFGQGFEAVAKEWLGVEGGVLAEGKARRGSFTAGDLEYIRRYTGEELRLLVEVVRKLKDARLAAGFTTSNLYSPANLATELFRKAGVKDAIFNLPPDLIGPAYRAFFGGRIEAVAYGTYSGRVVEFDITSAYPAALARLPNLANGTWRKIGYYAGPLKTGLYHVRWRFPEDRRFYPFPWRATGGRIYYPPRGEGWVWGVELFEPWNFDGRYIEVLEGWVFDGPGEDERPFASIAATFERRAELKKAGDPAEYPLKLAMNSAYGKLAQRKGVGGAKPSYHQIAYAGLITAITRAIVYSGVNEGFDGEVLSFNTDAVYVTDDTGFLGRLGQELGRWKKAEYDGIQILQSGVYRLRQGVTWLPSKGRGFGDRRVPWEDIVRAWDAGQTVAEVKLKDRFVSHRFADARNRLELGGEWEPVKRQVSIVATGKRADLRGWATVNPAKSLRWTEAEGIGISEYDLSASNLPPWETAPLAPEGTPISRRPGSPALSAAVTDAPREGATAPRGRRDRKCPVVSV